MARGSKKPCTSTMPMFTPDSKWVAPDLSNLPDWPENGRVGIDCETKDPYLKKLGPSVRRGGYIVGISFCIEETMQKFYLPIRHAGGGNLSPAQVIDYLKHQAKNFKGQLVGANLPYDLDYLAHEGVVFRKVKFFRDVQVAEPLINENKSSYSLFNIGKGYGIESKDESLLDEAAAAFRVDPKAGIWQLPAGYVGPYAENDAVSPLLILQEQEKLIEEHDLWNIWNLESQVLPILVKMRRRGVLIDQDRLAQVEQYSIKEATAAMAKLKHLTGVDVSHHDVMAAAKVAPILQEAGYKLLKTKNGQWNVDAAALGGMGEVGKTLLWARKVSKLRTTFAKSVREHMCDGRIHCTFNQIARSDDEDDMKGARYGRLSCVQPNLQQQPSRDEFAKMWRSIYIPEQGKIWGCLDYSQQEPRWTTHFAALMGYRRANEVAERYKNDPSMDNHNMMATLIYGDDVFNDPDFKRKRGYAKDTFLGICYGKGGAALCRDFGLPTRWAMRVRGEKGIRFFEHKDEALSFKYDHQAEGFIWEAAGKEGQAIFDEFDKEVPYVGMLANAVKKKAATIGEIRTVEGRALHFPQKADGSFDWVHKALNRLIQGSSADQTKRAMVRLDAEMPDLYLQLQVHDEFDASLVDEAQARQAAEIMSTAIPDTMVPFKVDVELGPNWGEIKEV